MSLLLLFNPTTQGTVQPAVVVTVAGTNRSTKTRLQECEVSQQTGGQPDEAMLVFRGFTPANGDTVTIVEGSITHFSGRIVKVSKRRQRTADAVTYACTCLDARRLFNRRLVTKNWVGETAYNVIADIVTNFASGFTYAHVSALLQNYTITTQATMQQPSDVMDQVMEAIGGQWRIDDLDVRATVDEELYVQPEDIISTNMVVSGFTYDNDWTPIRNRVFLEGQGSTVLSALDPGETNIPVAVADMFDDTGAAALAKLGPRVISYTGVRLGGAGSLVGPGVTPSAAPTASFVAAAGVESGVHNYAYTWVTASGETRPSPLASITLGFLTPPTNSPGLSGPGAGGSLTAASAYLYAVTFVNAAGETTAGPTYGLSTDAFGDRSFIVSLIPIGPTSTTARRIYRTAGGGSQLKLLTTIANNDPANFSDTFSDASLGVNVPVVNTAVVNQVALSGIALGPAGTTSRKVYRTVAAGSQLKLQQTIADNTSTVGVTDATADASLGADAPTGDTSALSLGVSNGGSFYTNASVVFPTDGAATVATSSAPIFTSASYNFVAADVGAYVYIKSGVNWTAGRYLIASVAANAATLTGACASVASPTAATWGIDYSTLASGRISFTDLVIGATPTQCTSAANPVGKNFIGNVIAISDGIGFSVQRVIVLSTSGTTATCDKTLGTASSTAGIGRLGGAAASVAVVAGATSMELSSAASFNTSGGWAVADTQAIRYTGISGNTLTGIPASGTGAIVAALSYGVTLTASAELTGVPVSGTGAIATAVTAGEECNLLVQEDDTPSQAVVALAEGGDGIHEFYVQDRRHDLVGARAAAQAELTLGAPPRETLAFTTPDLHIRAGKRVYIDLGGYTGYARIQTARVHWPEGRTMFAVTCSSRLYDLYHVLRQLQAQTRAA